MIRELSGVEDVSEHHLATVSYDLSIFASGYEERSTAFARRRSVSDWGKTLVLGFNNRADAGARRQNDDYFREIFRKDVVIHTDRPGSTAALVGQHLSDNHQRARILVDISSMSRTWYADIINWARFSERPEEVTIDFVYTQGHYAAEHAERVVSETISLAGFEGRTDPELETAAFLGLGYDTVTPAAVLEDLQPDWKFALVPSTDDAAGIRRTIDRNAAVLDELDGAPVLAPLLSMEATYRLLTEMIAPHVGLRNCVMIPLGPKPHVLAALLVATKQEEVSCLHVQGRSPTPVNVVAAGGLAICRATFRRQRDAN